MIVDNKDYGDNFDVTGGSSNDYDLDNFDVDAADNFSHTVHSEAEETNRNDADDDYGDNFDSQTGEDNKEYSFDDDYENNSEEYYINTTPSGKSKSGGKKKKKKSSNKAVAAVLTVAAVMCLVAAIVFAVTQCCACYRGLHRGSDRGASDSGSRN